MFHFDAQLFSDAFTVTVMANFLGLTDFQEIWYILVFAWF